MGPLKPDVAELVVAIICFAFVFVIVGRVLLPRIARVLDERHSLTDGRLDEADVIKEEIAEVAKDLQRELGEGRREAARVRQELIDEGAEAMASLRAEGQRVREELVASNHRAIAEERAVAEAALHAELGLIATELAGKVLGESLTDFVTDGDTVERFLADVQAHAEENATS